MARLIDADKLFPCANDKFGVPVKPNDKWETSLNELRAYIAKQPTVDPVIHCRDCVHWKTYNSSCPMVYEEWFDDEDDGLDIVTHDNTPDDGSGFCHMAKKKGRRK